MSPHTVVAIARSRRGLAAALAGAALLAAVPATASAHHSIRLRFQKQCPDTTCTGFLITASNRPIPGTTVTATLAPLWFESGVIGFSATETISSPRSSFTMNHLGVADQKPDPVAIRVVGVVVSGSWNGVPLAGALVHIRASGAKSASYLRGTLRIDPPAAAH
jgi:hypothetical protein